VGPSRRIHPCPISAAPLPAPGRGAHVEGDPLRRIVSDVGRALGDAALRGGEADHVQPVEFVAQVAPGVAGADFGDADEPCGIDPMDAGRLPATYFLASTCPNSVKSRAHVEICSAAYYSKSVEIAPLQGTRIDGHQI